MSWQREFGARVWLPVLLTGCAAILAACSQPQDDLVSPATDRSSAFLISNTNILDVRSGRMIRGQDVVVDGGRITKIRRASGDAPLGYKTVIEGEGTTLLPGLIEMHGHVLFSSAPAWKNSLPDPERNLQAYLYSGVTTVFDVGGLDNRIFKLRAEVAEGKVLGPRLYATGPIITAEGGHPVAIMDKMVPWWLRWWLVKHQTRQIASMDDVSGVIADVAGYAPDALKFAVDRIPEQTPRIRRELLAAAVREGKKHGLRAVAHIGYVEDAVDSGDAGVSLWVHGVYQEEIPDEMISKIASYRIPMVPTTVVFESYALLGREPRKATRLEKETVSSDLLAAFNEVPEDSGNREFFKPYLDHLFEQRMAWRSNVRRLHEAGVTILAGSDMQSGVFPGAGLHRELALLQESGLSPLDVIRAATLNAARYITGEQTPEFGLVEEGMMADLLLVNGDPTKDVAVLSEIREVVAGGVLLKRQSVIAD